MEIQSALNSGIQGFQKATESADEAARNIVAQTAVNTNYEQEQQTTAAPVDATAQSNDVPSLNQSVVDLKVAEHQAKASANVITTADETLGTLLDVTA